MHLHEIHDAKHLFKDCNDPRPWLVVEIREGDVRGCFPIASEPYGDSAFFLSMEHADFHHTGLTKECYIIDTHFFELDVAESIKLRGVLAGDLLEEFLAFAGI